MNLIQLFASLSTLATLTYGQPWASCTGFATDWVTVNENTSGLGNRKRVNSGVVGGIPALGQICNPQTATPFDIECAEVSQNGDGSYSITKTQATFEAEALTATGETDIEDVYEKYVCAVDQGYECERAGAGDLACPNFAVRFCCTPADGKPWIFVIDDTGSMFEEIDAVKTTISNLIPNNGDIVGSNSNTIPEYFILSTFDDPVAVGLANAYSVAQYTTPAAMEAAVTAIIADGGGDCAEYSLTGINNVFDFIEDPQSGFSGSTTNGFELFLFTDADPAPADASYPATAFTALLNRLGGTYNVRAHVILTDDCGVGISDRYQSLASQRGGFLIPTNNNEVLNTVNVINDFLVADAVTPNRLLVYIEVTESATSYASAGTIGNIELSATDTGSITVIVSDGFGSNPTLDLQYDCPSDGMSWFTAVLPTGAKQSFSGFVQITVEIAALYAANAGAAGCINWQFVATFNNRRRRLQTVDSDVTRIIAFISGATVSVDFGIYRVLDAGSNALDEVVDGSKLFCGDNELFRVYTFPEVDDSGNEGNITTSINGIDSVTLFSRDGSYSLEKSGVDVIYDDGSVSGLEGYYADFECNDLIGSGIDEFRITAKGTSSSSADGGNSGNSVGFQRSYDIVVELSQILVELKCDTYAFGADGMLICDLEVDVNGGISSVDVEYSLDNEGLFGDFVDVFVGESVLTSFPASTSVMFELVCTDTSIVDRSFSVAFAVSTSDESDITVIREDIFIAPIEYDIRPFNYPYACDTEICECSVNEHCLICHSNGCDQCQSGYFQKSAGYVCESCAETFGSGCVVCNDAFGCSQCQNGFVHSYDECSELWYCEDSASSGSDETGGVDLGDYLCPNDCGAGGCACLNCQDQTTCNGYCSQCDSGYFKLTNNHNCVDCEVFFGEGCMFCQDYQGCGQCKQGYTRTYDSNCGDNGVWYCKPN